MSSLMHLLIQPFTEFAFMRRALVATLALALGSGPIGTFLIMRRMSLVGDALSHAILPGAAIGFLIGGFSLTALGLGGMAAGCVVAVLAALITRYSRLREDASFASIYLISLALGVLIISVHGSSVDLLHVLFGTILAVDNAALLLVASIATLSLLMLAMLYRPLVADCVESDFLPAVSRHAGLYKTLFLLLVVLNLVAGFQALGTLMAVGLMMLPAASARFWAERLWVLAALSMGIAVAAGYVGLLVSYYANLPSGPAIILAAGVFYLLSLLFGRHDGLLRHRSRATFPG